MVVYARVVSILAWPSILDDSEALLDAEAVQGGDGAEGHRGLLSWADS
jgi:hypothetical protein